MYACNPPSQVEEEGNVIDLKILNGNISVVLKTGTRVGYSWFSNVIAHNKCIR